MGAFFSNIHVRKSDQYSLEELKEWIIEQMRAKGYILLADGTHADISAIIYAPVNSDWVSVASDTFEFGSEEDVKKVIAPISDRFCTDVLAAACYDSDYLLMNLINTSDNLDGWINVGNCEMKPSRRTNLAVWKKKVNDYDAFKSVMKRDYIFAEEAFYEAAQFLGMDKRQTCLEPDIGDELDKNAVCQLYFSAPEGATKELPRLRIGRFTLTPCKIGASQCVFVNNQGGKSKGIEIMFYGDYIENDELTFDNVTFECDFGSEKRKVIPIALRKVRCTDGTWALRWKDESFNIPPAVSKDIPMGKRMDLEFKKEFGVRFTVHGNPRKALDVKVYIIPLENREHGADCWYVYRSCVTKEKYIQEHNDRIIRIRNSGGGICEELMKMEDFDL